MSGVSESRFHMWRAVIAFAHADGVVVPEEREFTEQYLSTLPFSEAQKEALRQDLAEPKDIETAFNKIENPEDQAEFFQFARMLVWSDGDFDAQERVIIERVQDTQMGRVNRSGLEALVRETKVSGELERMAQDEAFRQDAESKLGLGAVLRALNPLN